jgi:hypothetical protein
LKWGGLKTGAGKISRLMDQNIFVSRLPYIATTQHETLVETASCMGCGTWILTAYGDGYCTRRHQASARRARAFLKRCTASTC